VGLDLLAEPGVESMDSTKWLLAILRPAPGGRRAASLTKRPSSSSGTSGGQQLKTLLVGWVTGMWGSREESIVLPAKCSEGSLRGYALGELVRDRVGSSANRCGQVLTCEGIWKRGEVGSCRGWLIGSVFVGETPLMVFPTPFTPSMTP
jgi:hypothetical protein